MLEELVEHARVYSGFDITLQLGWKDKQYDFGVAAGTVNVTRSPLAAKGQVTRRNVTAADTYLYGSGTKTFTAVGVLRLVDQGKVQARDPISKYINPFLLRNNGTTLEALFGSAIANATVLDVIQMGAGIADFEIEINGTYPLDAEMLENGNKVWTPYDLIRYAAAAPNLTGPGGHMLCQPGSCTAYSSTSYEVAGLLLASILTPQGDWSDFDHDAMSKAVLPEPARYPSFHFFTDDGRISDHLTVPGVSAGGMWEATTIYNQNPSMLGWTCGNLVANTNDVARFFYDVLAPDSETKILSEALRDQMVQLKALTTGWLAGDLMYGAGIMSLCPDRNHAHHSWKKGPSDWGYTFGHGGDTYGFQSFQGYTPTLRAAWSVVVNSDSDKNYASYAQCFMMQIATKRIANVDWDFGCKLPGQQTGQSLKSVYV